MADRYEEIARQYIEGVGGLFDLYRYEMAVPKCTQPEVEGARWMLMTLTNPDNRGLLDQLVEQSELRNEPSRLLKKGVSVKLPCRWSQEHDDVRL